MYGVGIVVTQLMDNLLDLVVLSLENSIAYSLFESRGKERKRRTWSAFQAFHLKR